MGNTSDERWSKCEIMAKEEKDDQLFPFPSQYYSLSPLDFSDSGYSPLDWQWGFLAQEESTAPDAFPLTEMFVNDPLYSSLDLAPSQTIDFHGDYMDSNNREMNYTVKEDTKKKSKRPMERGNYNSSAKMLTRQTISQYFYMPITQAAKELNIGLTLLKKRCRELGICRWPHRKLMSLQTLIKNVQELSKEGGEGAEQNLREALEILEGEKKLLEEIPDMELKEKTKRLRQACFKANYKKRKLMGMTQVLQLPSSSTDYYASNTYGVIESRDDHREEEMEPLFLCRHQYIKKQSFSNAVHVGFDPSLLL